MTTITNFVSTHPHVSTWIICILGIGYVTFAVLAGVAMILEEFGKLEKLCRKLGIKYK